MDAAKANKNLENLNRDYFTVALKFIITFVLSFMHIYVSLPVLMRLMYPMNECKDERRLLFTTREISFTNVYVSSSMHMHAFMILKILMILNRLLIFSFTYVERTNRVLVSVASHVCLTSRSRKNRVPRFVINGMLR